MTDKEVFTSQALERFADEPFQHLPFGEGEGAASYLGDPVVVDALIRVTVADILDMSMKAAAGEGEFSSDEARARVQRTVDVLLGRGNDYTSISREWNSEDGGIVAATRARYGVEIGTPDDTMAYAILTVLIAADQARELESEGQDGAYLIDAAVQDAVLTFTAQSDIIQPLGV